MAPMLSIDIINIKITIILIKGDDKRMAEEIIEVFECYWCEEDCPTITRFDYTLIFINDKGEQEEEAGFVCPECLATLFNDDPRQIVTLSVDRSCEIRKEKEAT